MRRLEMLSNTIFGVAMTLLAYDLPKASSFTQAPTWMGLIHVYAQPVIALTISFIVAGLFWFSHHRRLAVAPEGGRGVVFLNLFFLLAIIILPVTNGLYGSYRLDGVVAVTKKEFGYQVFNLGESQTVRLSYLIEVLEKAIGKKAVIDRQPPQPGDVPITYANIGKARSLLGYTPGIKIDAGIPLFIEWFQQTVK